MSAHDDVDFDTGQSAVVEVVADDGVGDEGGGGAVAGRMIGFEEVVVDGFGDVEDLEVIAGVLGETVDDVGGAGGVVSADVEEVMDVVLFEDFKDSVAGFGIWLGAGGAESGGGGFGDVVEVPFGEESEIGELFVDDAFDAMEGAVEVFDTGLLTDLFDDADEGLIDDAGGATGLADDCVSDYVFHGQIKRVG